MEDKKEEKIYKIKRIESGIRDAALYEGVKTAVSIGLFAMVIVVELVLDKDYNMDLNGTTLEKMIGAALYATSGLSIIRMVKGIANLGNLGFLGRDVREQKKQGKESLDFNELKFSEHTLFNMDDTNGPLKNVMLNGFFEKEKEDTSEVTKKL